ncbi:sodium:calcium antiporter [Butyricicoccus sp.]|uniref:sodium:calcium antiporter n=1 Tax=Butyricicoccus sp. TaxID=2049021 RepID=UPI003D7E6139
MIYLLYLLVAAGVVLFSVKASDYVDLLDKKTSLSGAFIGGIMLSAVTSLPELFTSISSTVLIHQPGLCLGNILGSDLFNMAMLSFFLLIFARTFREGKLSASHRVVTVFVFVCYLVMILNWLGILRIQFLSISLSSVIIVVMYILSIRYMSAEDSEDSDEEDTSPLTVPQIAVRFVLVSIGIVVLSIAITYITDAISIRLHLGQGMAGALFLGIATSLPEASSTVALLRMKNVDIAFGNIVGSNIFNFIIMAVVDILYRGSVYDFSDPQTVVLMLCGAAALPLMWIMMKFRNKATQVICPLGIIACYLAFLMG